MKIKDIIELLLLALIVILLSFLPSISKSTKEIAWVLNGAEIEFVNENNLEK